MNPLLDFEYCIPDGEAHVMPDGRLYLYGSMDIPGNDGYCSDRYHVFSTDDMINWTDHGVSFSSGAEHMRGLFPETSALYAPDAAYRDGKYFLYFCTADSGEGVAVSDSPCGPFSAVSRIDGADSDSIDPAVFIDDDGQAYYFWGQFSLRGAKMNPDMTSLDLSTVRTDILTEYEHGFHEGSSIRKYNGVYYMVYTDISRGNATCLGYATSDSPLGPYTKRGIIVDNMGCDPGTWNNHGSIECFKGQWYVFYHRSSESGNTSRRMCAEPIYFNPDGTVNEVVQTVGGASGAVDAKEEITAARAVRMGGKTHVTLTREYGAVLACSGNGGSRGWMRWAEYPDIYFESGVSSCTVIARGRGKLRFVTSENREIGSVCPASEDFEEYTFLVITDVRGVKPLWIIFEDGEADILKFRFE